MDDIVPPEQLTTPVSAWALLIMFLLFAIIMFFSTSAQNQEYVETANQHCAEDEGLVKVLTAWSSSGKNRQMLNDAQDVGCVPLDNIRVYDTEGESP